MKSSIQEYCKKINRELTFISILSLFISSAAFVIFTIYVYYDQVKNQTDVTYQEAEQGTEGDGLTSQQLGRPFGSRKGATYTFSWCQGSTRISEKNKIFFSSENEAKQSGRRLSKLCQK